MTLRTPTTSPDQDTALFESSPIEYLRTVFVGFFQGLFAQAPPGMYHWTPDEQTSEIYISDENPVKAEVVNMRPAITFTRGPMRFYSLGLDDMLEYDIRTGQKKKSVLVPGTFVINASSRVQLESERIAWIAAEQLWLLREHLMKQGFFEIGRSPEIGSPSPAGSIIMSDAGDEWYTTSVMCPIQFARTATVTPLGQRVVRDLQATLRARLPTINQQYRGPGGHGGAIASAGAEPPVQRMDYRPPPYAPDASDVEGGTPRAGDAPTILPTVPHPLNPAVRVTVRAARPNCPAIRPPSIGGRAIPIARTYVEDSSAVLTDEFAAEKRTFKV